jgi:hypothetical protein
VHLVRWQPLEVVLVAVQFGLIHQGVLEALAVQVAEQADIIAQAERAEDQEQRVKVIEVEMLEEIIIQVEVVEQQPQVLTVQAHRMVVLVY